ncbi:hypothetical protein GWI33_015152 [Rhynchophorus ferrugineus]|uniref:Ion transport domain-containing protein n=1 Tax=Rhynchophorus ferrugineus TaxID=354439 RepID=A0A834M4T0_RHYFE|nr:hypothetical protein GWI33_015152 [Rhynchophorus ferrugineus]
MGSNEINHNRPPKIQRVGSQICPTPNDELLEAILNNEELKVERILRNHPDLLSYRYEDQFNNTPLLIACSEPRISAEVVKVLLDQGADVTDKNMEDWQALHCAAKKTQYKILELILKKDGNVINNLAGGLNALHILIRYGDYESRDISRCAKVLIDKGINLNQGDRNNRTALFWAKKKKLDDVITVIENALNSPEMKSDDPSKSEHSQLLTYLRARDENDFISYRCNIDDFVNETDTESTFLQICCSNGLNKVAGYLLEKGADPNKTYRNEQTPIELAASRGYNELIKTLLRYHARLTTNTLCVCIKDIEDAVHKYRDCYNTLISHIKTQYQDHEVFSLLNGHDKMGYTPLHYAVRYADSDVIQELLTLGSSLGANSDFGVMPIQDIEPSVLEKHLDSCIIYDTKDKHWDKESFKVEYNYRSLIPPFSRKNGSGSQENLFKVSTDPEEGHFKQEILSDLVEETKVIFFMSKEEEFKRLLMHPVITSYLFMKWWRVQYLFWLNFSFYAAFFVSLVLYIFTDYADLSPGDKVPLLQFLSGLSYIPIPGVTVIVFCDSASGTKKQLSAISILLASFELVLLLGQHPFFSTNVVMLKTVSFNFFKFLAWYSILLVAFALSFFLLFIPSEVEEKSDTVVQAESNNKSSNADDDDNTFFDTPYQSVFKTIIMLTGEFDAGSINFTTFPITSKIIFALFIFMIAIILLNLLNGLAVSDTQMIKNDAELVSYIARAKYLQHVESMFFANIFPVQLYRKLVDVCCCFSGVNLNRWSMKGILAQRACLFPKYLQYRLVLYPNKRGLVELDSNDTKKKDKCFRCSGINLDGETVRRTKNIIQARNDHLENVDVKKMAEEIKSLQEKLDSLIQMLSDK